MDPIIKKEKLDEVGIPENLLQLVPKPGRTSYMNFVQAYRNSHGDLPHEQKEVVKMAAEAWRGMSEEQKLPYVQMAAAEREKLQEKRVVRPPVDHKYLLRPRPVKRRAEPTATLPAKKAKVAATKVKKSLVKVKKTHAKAKKVPAKVKKAPAKARKAPAKAKKSPAKSKKSPAKERKSPTKARKALAKAKKALTKAKKSLAKVKGVRAANGKSVWYRAH